MQNDARHAGAAHKAARCGSLCREKGLMRGLAASLAQAVAVWAGLSGLHPACADTSAPASPLVPRQAGAISAASLPATPPGTPERGVPGLVPPAASGQPQPSAAPQAEAARQDEEWLGLTQTASGAAHSPLSRLGSAQMAFAAGKPWVALRTLEKPPPQNAPAVHNTEKTAETFLHAAASLLVGRTGQAEVLNNAYFGTLPATRVWRGLYLMQAGQNSHTASGLLAAGFAQLRAYPAAVRTLILPQAATYVVRFGDTAAVERLDPLPDDPECDLARALWLARAGQTETARVALENLTASSSPQTAAYARAALVDLMLEKDLIAPAMALEAYGKLLENDGHPADLPFGPKARIRLGQAHALALVGQMQEALSVLDKVPPQSDAPQDVLSDAYLAVLKSLVFPGAPVQGAPVGAAQGVVLNEAERLRSVALHLPRVADGAGKAKLLTGYGRLLLQAGQADAAEAVFAQAAVLQDSPVARAEVDDLRAQAALQAHQPDVAQKALDRAASIPLPDDLATQRHYDAARLLAERGETEKALALLARDETDAGLDLRGRLYEQNRHWPDAVQVVGRLAARRLPEEGMLTGPQQALALRLATDAVAAQDSETLLRLKDWLAGRTLGRERDGLFAMQLQSIKASSPAL